MLTIHDKNPPLYLYTTVKIPPSPLPKLPLKPPQSTFFKLKPLVVTSPSFFFLNLLNSHQLSDALVLSVMVVFFLVLGRGDMGGFWDGGGGGGGGGVYKEGV